MGERLGRYDVEKRCAIEKEDYDTAKRKKEQMEEYRTTVYQQLEVHNLLDMNTVSVLVSPDPYHGQRMYCWYMTQVPSILLFHILCP